MAKRFVIGIDEVGRGALAGPITVAAVAISRRFGQKLKDSKKMSEKQREQWMEWIKNQSKKEEGGIIFTAASVYPKTIDRINIANAANLAATRALARLLRTKTAVFEAKNVFLDGGLFLNKNLIKRHALNARTVVRGDEKYNCIKLASIIAKTKRDHIMLRWHKKYPVYGFNRHKGYGTKEHKTVLEKCGPSKIHRLTFIDKEYKLKQF